MKVSVIIPAFNEAARIGETVAAVQNSLEAHEVIVVDDGSVDETAVQAAKAGARVFSHRTNQGKGSALNTACREISSEIVILLDGDLGKSAEKFSLLLPPIMEGSADVTVAKFPPPPVPGGFGLVKGLATCGVFRLTGQKLTAPLSGQRAMRIEVLQSILPFAPGFGVEVAAAIDILRKGWRIEEIEIDMEHNFSRRDWDGFIHRGRQFVDICQVLVKKNWEGYSDGS